MRQTKIFAAIIGSGILLTTLTGCTGNQANPAPAKTVSSAAPTVSVSSSAPAILTAAAARTGAAKTLADFYTETFNLDAATLKQAQTLNLKHTSYSYADYITRIEKLIPSLKRIDPAAASSTRAEFEYSYTSSALGFVAALPADSIGQIKYDVDKSKVKLSQANHVATVPSDALGITYRGKHVKSQTSGQSIHLIYHDGTWYLDPTQ